MDQYTSKSYQLVVKGNVKMLTMMDSFATKATYDLVSKGPNAIKPELQEYILEEKEVELTDYFNPNTYQLIEYVNKLAKIYNRQHVCVNDAGIIKGLLNMPEIKNKWDLLKKELMQINPVSAFEIIRNKERELANPTEVIANLSNTHFMSLFLYAFAIEPEESENKKHSFVRDRMGIGFMLPITQTSSASPAEIGYKVQTEAVLDEGGKLDKNQITSITGQMELDVKHYAQGSFQFDQNHSLVSAEMSIFEQLNNDYKSDLYLYLQST
jgi:hypothetical protein